jgi:hypothetical protein
VIEDQVASIQVEDVAKRYSARQGFRLVHYREVGLAHYYLRLRVVVMQEKEVSPISEFVLRTLDVSVDDQADIAGFLGLDASVVERALIDLRRAEEIDLIAPSGSGLQKWSLTDKGRRTLESARRLSPEEVSIGVYYDGILRRVVEISTEALIEPKQLRADDRMEIRPIPARAPHVDELSLGEVNQALAAYVRRRPGTPKRELLVVKAVLRGNLLFRPAVMLVYQAIERDDVQVAFAVDGILSNEHETAFAGANGPKLLGIVQNVGRPTASEIASALLRDTAASKIEDLSAAEALEEEEESATTALRNVQTKVSTVKTDAERLALQSDIEQAQSRVERAKKAIERLGVRLVPMLEHREILERAVDTSTTRLLINSPWIHSSAVDRQFLRRLERRLSDGLEVYIAYGLDSERRTLPGYREAEDNLQNLARSYRKMRITKLGDTHAKLLISDSSFLVVTSFNWLSFRGDHRRTFRDERGIMVTDPAIVDEQFRMIVQRMDDVDNAVAAKV